MKKIYALLLIVLPLISFGQQFELSFAEDSVKVDTLNKDVDFDIDLQNLTTNRYLIKWRITESTLPNGWSDYMCDSLCYTKSVRTKAFYLEPSVNFRIIHHVALSGDYGTGTSTVCFFEPHDSANTVQCFTVTAIADSTAPPLGIVTFEPTVAKASLSQNAPNPFRHRTTINYELTSLDGEMRIHDLTGKLVETIKLSNPKGQVVIGDRLTAGLYFYSLWDGGQLVDSKRMQVIE